MEKAASHLVALADGVNGVYRAQLAGMVLMAELSATSPKTRCAAPLSGSQPAPSTARRRMKSRLFQAGSTAL